MAVLHFVVFILYLTPMTEAQQPDLYMHKVMSGVQNYTEFCELMSMSTQECEKVVELSEPIDGVDETGQKMVVGATSQIAMFDACNPREQTIALPRHPDPDITIWPTCTRAMRCGGCCTSDVFSCEPTEIKEKFVKVFDTRLPYIGAHRFQFLGIRAVKIIEHVQCDAQCKTKKHECHKYQRYEARSCRCLCRQERLVHKSSCKTNQIWDDNECDCICPNRNTVKCPEPSYFSTDTCKCTLKTTVTGEIDLDKLFEQLDKGLIGPDILLENQDNDVNAEKEIDTIAGMKDVDGKVDFTESEEESLADETIEEESGVNDRPENEKAKMEDETQERSEKEKEEDVEKKTTVTTQRTPAQTTSDPCKSTKCFGIWKPKLLKNGRCQCFPPRG
ncbi:uncharacterized protein LOC123559236 [Mercenaria mercenaria]|uniref:uncharacterized protein LOC123559236 n=1 Tax=Mercenaria mercenaria TaxID=6596 RepID=UPI00234F1008|nr:uncharacterized protein LOC123559236 [Mercenaria mercenaria]